MSIRGEIRGRPGGPLVTLLLVAALQVARAGEVDPARDAVLATRIAALPDSGSSPWDGLVRLLLVATYDEDGSGMLDLPGELDAISCPVWQAIDRGVRRRWPPGLWLTYGIVDGGTYLGEVIGVSTTLRRSLDRKLVGCRLVDPRFLATSLGGRDPTARLRALGPASDPRWESRVSAVLLGAYDLDGDGQIGAADEVLAVPCSVWVVLDQRVHEAGLPGLTLTYGVEGAQGWTGDRLGLSITQREVVARAVRACEPKPPEPPRGASPDVVAQTLRSLPHASPATWEPAVRRLLAAAFDRTSNQLLDTAEEVRSLDCAVWGALDAAVRGVRGIGLYQAYGFEPTATWDGFALGFHADVRAIAGDALHGCGLDRVAPDLEAAARRLRSIVPGPGWRETAGAVMRAALDGDGSGAVDEADEADEAPCAMWEALDGVVRRMEPGGAYAMAVREGLDALGVEGPAGEEAVRRMADCGLAPGRSVGPLARRIAVLDEAEGTSEWDLAVAVLLLRATDHDASGWIDRADEVHTIPCDAWGVVDRVSRDTWGRGVVQVYGFAGGGPWWGDDLGFAWSARRAVTSALRRCGY
ncbi:MAG TPA: hypothetical protein PKA64_19390 [Myxococcota bacterium]|nr:hypothetical protein [Myxococcota bacterium]